MKTVWRIFLSVMAILLSFILIAATMLQAPLLEEPWNTILWFLIIPVLVQGYKIWKERGGKPPSKLFLQTVTFIVSGVFVYFSGGFIGLLWPAFPPWTGDLIAFVGGFFIFAGEFVAVIGVAFGAMMALYEGLLKRLFEIVGFAAPEKVASRKKVGFFA